MLLSSSLRRHIETQGCERTVSMDPPVSHTQPAKAASACLLPIIPISLASCNVKTPQAGTKQRHGENQSENQSEKKPMPED